jgi:hypothetical protein
VQVCSYDARHTLATLAHVHRHGGKKAPVALYVYEETAEGLARHMLLVYCLLDGTLPARERAEMLLELHGNVMVRDKAAAYLGKCDYWSAACDSCHTRATRCQRKVYSGNIMFVPCMLTQACLLVFPLQRRWDVL